MNTRTMRARVGVWRAYRRPRRRVVAASRRWTRWWAPCRWKMTRSVVRGKCARGRHSGREWPHANDREEDVPALTPTEPRFSTPDGVPSYAEVSDLIAEYLSVLVDGPHSPGPRRPRTPGAWPLDVDLHQGILTRRFLNPPPRYITLARRAHEPRGGWVALSPRIHWDIYCRCASVFE